MRANTRYIVTTLILCVSAAHADEELLFNVMDVFSISGGDVEIAITGKIESGSVTIGDTICLHSGSGTREITVGALQFRGRTDTAVAGDIGGIGVDGITKKEVSKGDTITASCESG